MPSVTIYVPQDGYDYARETSDDKSVGKRLQELALKGIEVEQGGSNE